MSASIAVDPLAAEAERLDGAGALDGLGEGRVDLRSTSRTRAGSRPWRGRGTSAGRSPAAARRARTAARPTSRRCSAAAKVTTAVTTAIIHSGSAQRTDQPSCSTSRQVRVSRSPEPADSTTPTGSARVLSTKSSRSSASTCSPSTWLSVARVAGEHGLQHEEAGEQQRRSGRRGRWWCRSRPPRPGRRAAAARPGRPAAASTCRPRRRPEQAGVPAGEAARRSGARRRSGDRAAGSRCSSRGSRARSAGSRG